MIFVDTGAWYEANAERGPDADAIRLIMDDRADELATSVPVLTELWMLMAARRDRP